MNISQLPLRMSILSQGYSFCFLKYAEFAKKEIGFMLFSAAGNETVSLKRIHPAYQVGFLNGERGSIDRQIAHDFSI